MNQLDIAKVQLALRLGDSALIIGHRLSEWCGHGPILEEDIAITNIALDFVGLSRNLYTYVAEVDGKGKTEDDYAYLRDVVQYRNSLITEQPNGDFAVTIARQFLYDTFTHYYYHELKNSADEGLKAIAEKAAKEMDYHLRHTQEWMFRLGDGTEESNQRLQNAMDELWMYTGDLFSTDSNYELLVNAKIAPDMKEIKQKWDNRVTEVLSAAKVQVAEKTYMQQGSLTGNHTEHLGFLLAEMQFMQRAYPNSNW